MRPLFLFVKRFTKNILVSCAVLLLISATHRLSLLLLATDYPLRIFDNFLPTHWRYVWLTLHVDGEKS